MDLAFLREVYLLILLSILLHVYSSIEDTLSYFAKGNRLEAQSLTKRARILGAICDVIYFTVMPIVFFYAIYVVKIDYPLHRGEAKAHFLYIIEFYTLAIVLTVIAADSILEARKKIAASEISHFVQLALPIFHKVFLSYLFYWFIMLYSPWPVRKRDQEYDGLWIALSPESISHWFVLANITAYCVAYFYYRNKKTKREN